MGRHEYWFSFLMGEKQSLNTDRAWGVQGFEEPSAHQGSLSKRYAMKLLRSESSVSMDITHFPNFVNKKGLGITYGDYPNSQAQRELPRIRDTPSRSQISELPKALTIRLHRTLQGTTAG